jgi:hypothetical protein
MVFNHSNIPRRIQNIGDGRCTYHCVLQLTVMSQWPRVLLLVPETRHTANILKLQWKVERDGARALRLIERDGRLCRRHSSAAPHSLSA